MKKLAVTVICLLTVLLMTGCEDLLPAILGEDEETAISATDAANEPDETQPTETPADDEETDELSVPATYRPIAAEWKAAPTDAEYLAAARERLDEYTQLITSLSALGSELPKRCASAQEISSDGEYMPIYAAFVQWSKNVREYDASALSESTLAVHEKMTDLASLTDEYIGIFPSLCFSADSSENDGYINDILSLMVELNGMLG